MAWVVHLLLFFSAERYERTREDKKHKKRGKAANSSSVCEHTLY